MIQIDTSKYTEYIGQALAPDEFLLKIRASDNVGFMTRLTKAGKLPVVFADWGKYYEYVDPETGNTTIFGWWINTRNGTPRRIEPTIYVIADQYLDGWRIEGFRHGESAVWAKVKHPHGFILEIKLDRFIEICKDGAIQNGELIGRFKWENGNLTCKLED